MGRTKLVDAPQQLCVQIRGSIMEKVRQELFSEIEGRVPYGAASALVNTLFEEWLERRGRANG